MVFVEKPKLEIYEETTIELRMAVKIKNQGQAPAFNIPVRLAIPKDHEPVQYSEEIIFSEPPDRYTNDSHGNQFVHYLIERIDPQKSKNITIDLKLRLVSVDFNVQKAEIGDYDEDLDEYLGESSLINLNDESIIDLAREIAGDSKDIVDIAWNTYEWIIDNIYYQQIAGEWDASTTLKNGEGGSAELANLFVSLARANNIPARRISGWANHFDSGEELQQTRFSHGWAEINLPGFGWVPVDPTWGKSQKFEHFAKSHNSHIIMTTGAGIHFFTRGPYSVPFGETEVNSDYSLIIGDIFTKNLSLKRNMISFFIFMIPLIFALFIIYKKLQQRHI